MSNKASSSIPSRTKPTFSGNGPAPQTIQYFNEPQDAPQRGYFQSEFNTAYQHVAVDGAEREKVRKEDRQKERQQLVEQTAGWSDQLAFIQKELNTPVVDTQRSLLKNKGDLHNTLLDLTGPTISTVDAR